MSRRPALLAAVLLVAAVGTGTALLLRLGGNGRASTGVGPTGGGPTGSDDDGPPIVLRGDGLGALPFGAPVDEVIAGLTLRWAPPTSDTGWRAAASSPFGVCPGTEVRAVGWRGLSVLFSDGPTPQGPAGRRHFFTWEYQVDDPTRPAPDRGGSRPPLNTENGISVGATVAALRQAYGARLEFFDESAETPGDTPEPPGRANFGVQLPDGSLFGSLTSLDPAGVVLTLVGGGGCGE